MSDAIVRLLLEEHQPGLLDAIGRVGGASLGPADLERIGGAMEAPLSAAVRRAFELGYREALAARAKAEAAKPTAGVLVDGGIGFAGAPPPGPPAAGAARDEGAEKAMAEVRALVSHWGEGGQASQSHPPRAPKVDLSLFGEALPEELEGDDEEEDDDAPVDIAAAAEEDDEEESASREEAPPPPDALAEEDDGEDEDDDEAGEGGDAPGPESRARSRVRRTNAEIAAVAARVLAYIQAHPATKAAPGREALGLVGSDWQAAVKRLGKEGRIFWFGATKARTYYPMGETKSGKPRKLTKAAFILTLPRDARAADVVAAAQDVGLDIDDRYVHAVRTGERRRLKREAAAARAQAIVERFAAVATSPRDPEGFRELRRAHTQARRADGIWVACQALATLGAADPSEHAFYEARRAEGAAHTQVALLPELRARHALHPAADRRVSLVIDYLLPALLERYGRPTAAQGYTAAHRVDPTQHSVLSETLVYAGRVFGIELPPMYQHGGAPIAIFSIHGDVPTIGLGEAAAAITDGREAAFVAANHLSYFLPGHYARRLVPMEPELRRWVEAALDLSRGATRFEHLSLLEQTVLQTQVDPEERKIIARETEGLEARDIDLLAWFKGVDATADRLGLVLCHDLERALHLLRGGEATGDDATEARVDTLRTWSVSDDYLAVRAALGIAVE